MNQYIFTVSAFTKTCIDRIIAFFSSTGITYTFVNPYFCRFLFYRIGVIDSSPVTRIISMNQRTFLQNSKGIIQNRVIPVSPETASVFYCAFFFPALLPEQWPYFFLTSQRSPKFQIRHSIQIPSMSCSFNIFIISRHTDHCCIVCTENR